MVKVFYELNKSSNKNVLFEIYGKEIFEEIISKKEVINFPFFNTNGDYKYEEDLFDIKEIDICSMTKYHMED